MVFSDQIALVTGANSGIGKAIAHALADNGATVCVLGRRRESVNATVSEIHRTGGRAFPFVFDLVDDAAIWDLRATIAAQFKRVNLLIHCAAVHTIAPIQTASIDDFDRLYRTNVRAPYLLTQALLPLLVPNASQIVFVNSTAGLVAKSGVGQFAATKFALKAIADSIRAEVSADGIRVMSVFPGRTATPTQERIFAEEGRMYEPDKLLQPEQVAEVIVNSLKLPSIAEVTDLTVRGTINMSVNHSVSARSADPAVHELGSGSRLESDRA